MSGTQQSDPPVTFDGQTMPESEFLKLHPNDDANPWLRLGDGQMVHLDDWLQQGPMVTDGGSWMPENQFLWDHRNDPDLSTDPWVALDDGSMVRLDEWLQEGPLVSTPYGTMTGNQFYYDYGTQDGGDPWVLTGDGSQEHPYMIMHQSEYAETGPVVTGPDGQHEHLGQFLLDNPNDSQNPWLFLDDGQGNTTAIKADEYQKQMSTNLADMRHLSESMQGHADDLATAYVTFATQFDTLYADFGKNAQARDFRDQLDPALDNFKAELNALCNNLVAFKDSLHRAHDAALDMENRNLAGLGRQAVDEQPMGLILSGPPGHGSSD